MERGAPSAAAGIPSVESQASRPHKISIPLYQRALHLFRKKFFLFVKVRIFSAGPMLANALTIRQYLAGFSENQRFFQFRSVKPQRMFQDRVHFVFG